MNFSDELTKFVGYINKVAGDKDKLDLLKDFNLVDNMIVRGFDNKTFSYIFNKYRDDIEYYSSFINNRGNGSNNTNYYDQLLFIKFVLLMVGLRKYVVDISEDKLRIIFNSNNDDIIKILKGLL